MELQHIDVLRVRAADGLASADELARLREAGIDPLEWGRLGAGLRSALDGGAPPDVSGAVLSALGLSAGVDVGGDLRSALDGGAAPDVSEAVLSALGLSAGVDVGGDLRCALDGGAAPDVSGDVLSALGLSAGVDVGGDLRAALDGGAAPDVSGAVLSALGMSAGVDVGGDLRSALDGGVAPDVSSDVLSALGLSAGVDVGGELRSALDGGVAPDVSGAVLSAVGGAAASAGLAPAANGRPEPAQVVALADARSARRPWLVAGGLAGGVVAMAAAALMAVVGAGVATDPGYAYELAAVNEIEILDMSVGEEAMVQVMQFEADAPTIIFIDVADEPSEADGDEGTTL